MIRLSGTAADAAGAGQLQGSSGFGRRSLFRARRDGPDVPEKPVRRCFGQKVPGNGWAFANFFYLWRSKQYAMMDLKTIRAELRKLTAIVDGWEPSGEIPALERDLALEKLRTLYDAVRFTEVESLPEFPVAETEPAAAPVPCDADSQHEKHKSGDTKDEGGGTGSQPQGRKREERQISAVCRADDADRRCDKEKHLEKPGSLAGGRHLCMLIVLVECCSLTAVRLDGRLVRKGKLIQYLTALLQPVG